MRQKIFALDGALRATAQEALAMDRSRATAFFAGLALAMAGNTRQAAAVVDELSKRFPGDTVVNNSWGPTIRSEIEVNRGNASKAIELLQIAFSYEAGFASPWCPKWPLVATALLQLSVLRLSFLEDRRASATRQLRQTATKARMRSFVPPGG